jgi:protein-S-isoprenylcysteine O-methyltransferase Ste14
MTAAPTVPPPFVALTAAVAQRLLSRNGNPPGPLRRIGAVVLLGAAAGLAGSAAGLLRSGGTTFDPHHPERSTALVTDGVYGLTRNPIYVGFALVLLAHAVHRGSVLALLPIAGYVAWIDRIQIPAEEAALRTLFGVKWEAYCSSAPRWLPRPSRGLTSDAIPAGPGIHQ